MSTETPRRAGDAAPALFAHNAGPLALTAGALLVGAQVVMWSFDQRLNAATAQHPVFVAAKIGYLIGFVILLFAVIAAHGLQARQAGQLGSVALSVAIVGTMLLAGDLWFESFAVPGLAAAAPQVLTSAPATLLALGAISSYLLFALGWTLFGIASLRAHVLPAGISLLLIVGGVAGYSALLAPGGIPLGVALTSLGLWLLTSRRGRSAARSARPR